MAPVTALPRSYALLADGTIVEIRPASPDDTDAVTRFHQAMSPDNLYLRFFSMSKRAAEQEARRVCRPADADHAALLALLGTQVVGVASYERTSTPGAAEVAFAVADDMHGRGIATLLLRVSRLADDLPQAAELDLNPVIARPDGAFAVDARVRVTSHLAADPFLRQLRLPPAADGRDVFQ
jgi:GNAT superfamily N-acetyltransferase